MQHAAPSRSATWNRTLPVLLAVGLAATVAFDLTARKKPEEQARPRSRVTTLTCHALPDVPGKTETVQLVEYPPLAFTARHVHGGSVTAYVVRGAVRSQLDGGSPQLFATGATWCEPYGTVHDFAENPSSTSDAAIVAVTIADHCAQLTTFLH